MVGDSTDAGDGFVKELDLVACDEEYSHQVFALTPDFQSLSADDSIYPGEEELEEYALRSCESVASAYLGRAVSSTQLSVSSIFPTVDTWNDDALVVLRRNSLCLLSQTTGDLLKGSLEQACLTSVMLPSQYGELELDREHLLFSDSDTKLRVRARLTTRPSGRVVVQVDENSDLLEVTPPQVVFDSENWNQYDDFYVQPVRGAEWASTQLAFTTRPPSGDLELNSWIVTAHRSAGDGLLIAPKVIRLHEGGIGTPIFFKVAQTLSEGAVRVALNIDSSSGVRVFPKEVLISNDPVDDGSFSFGAEHIFRVFWMPGAAVGLPETVFGQITVSDMKNRTIESKSVSIQLVSPPEKYPRYCSLQ